MRRRTLTCLQVSPRRLPSSAARKQKPNNYSAETGITSASEHRVAPDVVPGRGHNFACSALWLEKHEPNLVVKTCQTNTK